MFTKSWVGCRRLRRRVAAGEHVKGQGAIFGRNVPAATGVALLLALIFGTAGETAAGMIDWGLFLAEEEIISYSPSYSTIDFHDPGRQQIKGSGLLLAPLYRSRFPAKGLFLHRVQHSVHWTDAPDPRTGLAGPHMLRRGEHACLAEAKA